MMNVIPLHSCNEKKQKFFKSIKNETNLSNK
uniref:Uncharacterized protein n=1 Tax=Lepeophtheirus salmonis TaxID=72036 RepID=A0A0K2U452_LEPSM